MLHLFCVTVEPHYAGLRSSSAADEGKHSQSHKCAFRKEGETKYSEHHAVQFSSSFTCGVTKSVQIYPLRWSLKCIKTRYGRISRCLPFLAYFQRERIYTPVRVYAARNKKNCTEYPAKSMGD